MQRPIFASLQSLFGLSDEQAMWRVQTQDDHRAFVQLLERWEEPIARLCARMTGDLHRGEDMKQETFARVFEKRKSFQPNARLAEVAVEPAGRPDGLADAGARRT